MEGLNVHYITHFKFCNIVLLYGCRRIIWMDYPLQFILH